MEKARIIMSTTIRTLRVRGALPVAIILSGLAWWGLIDLVGLAVSHG